MLEPLANAARLKILLSLCEGKKSFSKIAQLTNLRGGHLIFHLNKLSAAGLIAQEDNKGDYVITQRGIEAAKKVSLLQIK
jgi:predicted transcriptional regulator